MISIIPSQMTANWALLLFTTGFLGSPAGALVDLCLLSTDDFLVILALATVLLTMVGCSVLVITGVFKFLLPSKW
jgi:hypothetical protein